MSTLGDLTERGPTKDPLIGVLTTCTICQIRRTTRKLIEDDILAWEQVRECPVEIPSDIRLVESFVCSNGCRICHR